jgi:hypothetical protein
MTIGLREAAETERDVPFDRYRAGLHHVALRVLARDDVDRVDEARARFEAIRPGADQPLHGEVRRV